MFLRPKSSGATRAIISPSVSINSSRAAPAENLAIELRDLFGLPQHEGVVVGDDDARFADAVEQVGRDKAQGFVNVLGV